MMEQDRLDAKSKTRSNLFNWRGQFTPEFVEYMLNAFMKRGGSVLDPFSGSGTVLQESARIGLSASGLEINPSAYAMSAFFEFCNYDQFRRASLLDSVERKLNIELNQLAEQPIFVESKTYRESYSNLLNVISSLLPTFDSGAERVILLNILFQSEKDKKLTVKGSLLRSFQYIAKSLFELPFTDFPITAYLDDARHASQILDKKVDLVLTSPPYINVFNYHQNYRGIIESINYNLLEVANSEFGANRKHRGNRFKTVIQYSMDMELSIRSCWEALKPTGKAIMILGRESNVRGVPFMNGKLIIDIIENCGGFKNIRILERGFTNKFGTDIKEDIIIADKDSQLKDRHFGKSIALAHLENALCGLAEGDVKSDLRKAVEVGSSVEPSPIFNLKNLIYD